MLNLVKLIIFLIAVLVFSGATLTLTSIWGELIHDWENFHSLSYDWDLVLMTIVTASGTLIIALLFIYTCIRLFTFT